MRERPAVGSGAEHPLDVESTHAVEANASAVGGRSDPVAVAGVQTGAGAAVASVRSGCVAGADRRRRRERDDGPAWNSEEFLADATRQREAAVDAAARDFPTPSVESVGPAGVAAVAPPAAAPAAGVARRTDAGRRVAAAAVAAPRTVRSRCARGASRGSARDARGGGERERVAVVPAVGADAPPGAGDVAEDAARRATDAAAAMAVAAVAAAMAARAGPASAASAAAALPAAMPGGVAVSRPAPPSAPEPRTAVASGPGVAGLARAAWGCGRAALGALAGGWPAGRVVQDAEALRGGDAGAGGPGLTAASADARAARLAAVGRGGGGRTAGVGT